jgi:hypothetical protein
LSKRTDIYLKNCRMFTDMAATCQGSNKTLQRLRWEKNILFARDRVVGQKSERLK